jgi:hypothetical protein
VFIRPLACGLLKIAIAVLAGICVVSNEQQATFLAITSNAPRAFRPRSVGTNGKKGTLMIVMTFEVSTHLRCQVMRRIGAIFGITAIAVVVFSSPPAAAFGIHLGPFYLHAPFVGHHYYRHRLHMRANPNEGRTRPNDVSRGGGYGMAARGGNAAKIDQTNREVSTEGLESCTGLVPGVTNLSIDQIRQTVNPTPDQGTAFDDLSAASSLAKDVIKSSCPSSIPRTPVGRLDATERRLDAIIKAIHIIRSPLGTFYEALSDEQGRQFNEMKVLAARAHSAASLCNQQAGSFIDVPVQRIEDVLQPAPEQESAFDNLRKATQRAADQLESSCPTEVPQSPMARLDAIETQLKATRDAIKAVRPALENFYASLSDDQKAKFNVLGPVPRAASSQPQGQSGSR